jgi:hypothetical protein
MKLKTSAFVILIVMLIVITLRHRRHVAWKPITIEPRVETTEALDAPQVLRDEDVGSVSVSAKDNPDDVLNKAAWSLVADTAHSCAWEGVDPSYRTETLMEVAGRPASVHWDLPPTTVVALILYGVNQDFSLMVGTSRDGNVKAIKTFSTFSVISSGTCPHA